jgi:hypothetical protein
VETFTLSRNREVQREILPIPDRPHTDPINYETLAQGGAFGGWSLYAKDSKPKYCYNFAGLRRFYVEGNILIPAGEHQVLIEFDYNGGGLAKRGMVPLYLDGETVGEGRVEATVLMVFLGDETCDVGSDSGTPVSDDYDARGDEFSDRVGLVQIDLGEDADHLISPQERLQLAMTRQ